MSTKPVQDSPPQKVGQDIGLTIRTSRTPFRSVSKTTTFCKQGEARRPARPRSARPRPSGEESPRRGSGSGGRIQAWFRIPFGGFMDSRQGEQTKNVTSCRDSTLPFSICPQEKQKAFPWPTSRNRTNQLRFACSTWNVPLLTSEFEAFIASGMIAS